jgi:protein-S-isoprenylcysteine O-methyltransferase Ste14
MPNLEHKIPPPIVALLVAAGMFGLAKLLPRVAVGADVRIALAVVIALAGIALGLAAVTQFHRAHTTHNPLRPDSASALVTGGVFRVSRNPMYAGLMLGLLAWAVFLASPVALAGPVVFIMFINRFQIAPEERAMEKRFGAEFAAYRARVRRWI